MNEDCVENLSDDAERNEILVELAISCSLRRMRSSACRHPDDSREGPQAVRPQYHLKGGRLRPEDEETSITKDNRLHY